MIKNILKVVIRALVTKDRLHDKVTNLLSSILSDISIYDIGASYFYHKRFEVFYKSKNSVLHSIDPNSNNLLYLDNWKFKSIVKKFPYAVGGSNEERILNVTKIDSGSSLLNFDFNKNNDHRIVKENLLPIKQKKITVKSFKDLYRDTVREKDLVIFKIDTQGTELEILESIVQNDLKEKILCVEVENGIATNPINPSGKNLTHLLNYFEKLEFEVIDVKVVRYLFPKANKNLKNQTIPKECDWVFMKKFSYIINQNVDYQIAAISCYVSYNLYGEASELIKKLITNPSLENSKKKVLGNILKILN